jgi:hypothetical protein
MQELSPSAHHSLGPPRRPATSQAEVDSRLSHSDVWTVRAEQSLVLIIRVTLALYRLHHRVGRVLHRVDQVSQLRDGVAEVNFQRSGPSSPLRGFVIVLIKGLPTSKHSMGQEQRVDARETLYLRACWPLTGVL